MKKINKALIKKEIHVEEIKQSFLQYIMNEKDPALLDYLKKSGKLDKVFFAKMDIEFIRVLEDLVAILIKKNVIMITDFNEHALKKLISRQTMRDILAEIYAQINLQKE